MSTAFGPLKEKIVTCGTHIQQTLDSVEQADVSAYNSIPELSRAHVNLYKDVNQTLAHTMNSLETTEATNAAAVAAKSTTGISKSLAQIITLAQEIRDATKCFSQLEKNTANLNKISNLLNLQSIKVGNLSDIIPEKDVKNYLYKTQSNMIEEINTARINVVNSVTTSAFNTKSTTANAIISRNTLDIDTRTRLLLSQGKSTAEIAQDSQILLLTKQINIQKALLQELQELGYS